MDDSEFNRKVDETLQTIEEAVENCDADLDWDLASGILTIDCTNSSNNTESQVIVNRQGPTRQIWVASRSGGFHFDYDPDKQQWLQGDLELFTLLNQALSEQTGQSVQLV